MKSKEVIVIIFPQLGLECAYVLLLELWLPDDIAILFSYFCWEISFGYWNEIV